jgi:lipid-A-disaccharide synthase-like uncharacterized protein
VLRHGAATANPWRNCMGQIDDKYFPPTFWLFTILGLPPLLYFTLIKQDNYLI